MAKVLQNFLIGVGLDTEDYDKGAKNVEDSLSRIRTLTGFTGAAITGAFAAAGASAVAAGKRVNDFNLAAEKLKTPTAYVYNYGRAIAALGGNAEEALAALTRLEEGIAARSHTKDGTMPGEIDLAMAGVDINALRGTHTGAEMMRELARQIPDLNQAQQLRVQNTLGFSDAVMRSLRGGTAELDASIARAGELYGEFGRATEAARDHVRAIAELNTRLEGIGETLADNILPSFTGVIDSLGGFIDRNRDLVDQVTRDNPEASSLVGTSAMAIGAGVTLRGLGIGGLGRIAMGGGVAGMAIGAGLIAKDMRPDDIENITGYRPGDYIFDNTPLDAARDAYNAIADKYGLERSEKGSGVISHLEGSYDRLNDQMMGFDDYLRRYVESGGPRPESVEPIDVMRGDWLPMNQENYYDGYRPSPIVESPTSGFITPYESIYGGGEVDNVEAARFNQEVVVLRELRQQSETQAARPRIDVKSELEVHLEVDGRALDSRVTEVIERREREAIEDVTSSVNR